MKKIKKGILFITLASLVTTFSMSMRPVNAIDYLGIAQSVAWQIKLVVLFSIENLLSKRDQTI